MRVRIIVVWVMRMKSLTVDRMTMSVHWMRILLILTRIRCRTMRSIRVRRRCVGMLLIIIGRTRIRWRRPCHRRIAITHESNDTRVP